MALNTYNKIIQFIILHKLSFYFPSKHITYFFTFLFQFMIDCEESVFKFEKLTGTVLANSKITVIIRFCPTHPINYYKRLACMVHNQVM